METSNSKSVKSEKEEQCVFCDMEKNSRIDMGVVLEHFSNNGNIKICEAHKEKLDKGISKVTSNLKQSILKKVFSR